VSFRLDRSPRESLPKRWIMETSSITRRLAKRTDFRKWAWWELPRLLRVYVALVPLTALVLAAFAASRTTWHATDLGKFSLLLRAGLISVAATSRIAYLKGGMTRDFITVWVLPIAILLPPVYAMMAPLPLYVLTQWRVHKGVIYRWVFTVGAIGLGYGGASFLSVYFRPLSPAVRLASAFMPLPGHWRSRRARSSVAVGTTA